MRRIWAAFAIIALLSQPALLVGWMHDDFIQREMVAGSTANLSRDASELYCFVGGPKALAAGWEVWWRSPQLSLCFFRPLSSLTLALDYTVGRPMLAHLHGLLWLLAACAGVTALAWTLFGPSLAALAGLIYGVSSYTSSPVAWVAARHAVVSAALVAWGLCLYVRSRQRQRAGLFGLIVLALSLLAGEGALGGLGFVLAYELLAAPAGRRVRGLHAAAAAVLGAAYVGFYVRSGYGAAGAGGYLDPLHHSGEFLAALPGRLLGLLAEAAFGAPSALWSFGSHLLLGGLGLLALLIALAALSRSSSAVDPEPLRRLHFVALGTLLCTIPAAAAVLGGRVLLVPGIGLSILFAAALTPWRASAAVIALALGVLLLNPLSRLAQIMTLRRISLAQQQLSRSPLPGCEGAAHLILLGTDEFSVTMYAPYLLSSRLRGETSWQQLTLASGDIEVSRPDARTLHLRARQGQLLGGLSYTMNRPPRSPLVAGMQLRIAAGKIFIEAAEPAAILALRVELPVSADDHRFCWLRYDGKQLLPLSLPSVGGELRIPHARGPMSF